MEMDSRWLVFYGYHIQGFMPCCYTIYGKRLAAKLANQVPQQVLALHEGGLAWLLLAKLLDSFFSGSIWSGFQGICKIWWPQRCMKCAMGGMIREVSGGRVINFSMSVGVSSIFNVEDKGFQYVETENDNALLVKLVRSEGPGITFLKCTAETHSKGAQQCGIPAFQSWIIRTKQALHFQVTLTLGGSLVGC
ncbi:hypothetical protein GOBAR_AA01529 [Gossypium barbadense]|uniref:Uncharacterized protein n=1 Tax=Gossypium barbadense TaxID=3634 RepID=A0A2P5YTX7_GOSBA|nr:hypothetical protein GOBAR_AA01529 [Gossypium barbadense]